MPYETVEFFPTVEALQAAVNERGASEVAVVGQTPFTELRIPGVLTVADLVDVPCHVINSDPVIHEPGIGSYTAFVHVDRYGTIYVAGTEEPTHTHEGGE
jgi:hypothetical protein